MKARDIIPGWPRGRSASRPLAKGSVWPWVYVFSLMGPEPQLIGAFPRMEFQGLSRKMKVGDHTFSVTDSQMRQMDAEINQAEEHRKADTMEMFYVLKRIGGERASDWPECLFELIVGLSEAQVRVGSNRHERRRKARRR